MNKIKKYLFFKDFDITFIKTEKFNFVGGKSFGNDGTFKIDTYKVLGNGDVLATSVAAAGTKVSCPVTVPSSAIYKLEVVLSNSVGDSPKSDMTVYIGTDSPLAVNNLKVVRTGDVNTVSWNSPTGTKNGGYMNVDDLRYKIVRMPIMFKSPQIMPTVFSPTHSRPKSWLFTTMW